MFGVTIAGNKYKYCATTSEFGHAPHRTTSSLLVAQNMSDILVLNCWILGDASQNAFTIKIANSEKVDSLKEEIAKKTKSEAAAHTLYLWKVSK